MTITVSELKRLVAQTQQTATPGYIPEFSRLEQQVAGDPKVRLSRPFYIDNGSGPNAHWAAPSRPEAPRCRYHAVVAARDSTSLDFVVDLLPGLISPAGRSREAALREAIASEGQVEIFGPSPAFRSAPPVSREMRIHSSRRGG